MKGIDTRKFKISDDKPIIAHSVERWLPTTMVWIFNQLRYGENTSSIVLANSTQNLDQFPWPYIYVAGTIEYFVFRVFRKVGFPYSRYSVVHDSAIKNLYPKILHSHFGDKGWYDLPLAKRNDLKHIVTFYGYDLSLLPANNSIWNIRYKRLFSEADIFLCEGPFMARSLINLGCPEDKIMVQRLGVEVDKIQFIPRRIYNNETIKILIAATFREKKGIPYALLAISRVREKYPDLQVTIIGESTGKPREEQEKRRILNVVKTNGLESYVKFLGFQTHQNLFDEAYKHHIFISPSVTASDGDTEGGAPVTIIEMAATGMPIISSNHCDIPQIIENGMSGFLAEERDVEGLTSHLYWLLENRESWREITHSSRNHIEKNFNVESQVLRLNNIYQKILEY